MAVVYHYKVNQCEEYGYSCISHAYGVLCCWRKIAEILLKVNSWYTTSAPDA